MSAFKEFYQQEAVPALIQRFGYQNIMEVPKLSKIALSMGVGEAIQSPQLLEHAVEEMTQIAGQKAVITQAKRSVAAFKVRAGMNVGCRVTLRRERMYEFFNRLVNTALPQIRDFRGVNPNSFDGRGNYSMGIQEQVIFPEIDYDSVSEYRGMDITVVTTARTDEEAYELLRLLGVPFRE